MPLGVALALPMVAGLLCSLIKKQTNQLRVLGGVLSRHSAQVCLFVSLEFLQTKTRLVFEYSNAVERISEHGPCSDTRTRSMFGYSNAVE
jgi:hypothetical protein